MSKEHWRYLELRPHRWRQQLSVIGRRLLASNVWRDILANGSSRDEAADNWDLPVEAIDEIVRYCEGHQSLLQAEAQEERSRLAECGLMIEVPGEDDDVEARRSTS